MPSSIHSSQRRAKLNFTPMPSIEPSWLLWWVHTRIVICMPFKHHTTILLVVTTWYPDDSKIFHSSWQLFISSCQLQLLFFISIFGRLGRFGDLLLCHWSHVWSVCNSSCWNPWCSLPSIGSSVRNSMLDWEGTSCSWTRVSRWGSNSTDTGCRISCMACTRVFTCRGGLKTTSLVFLKDLGWWMGMWIFGSWHCLSNQMLPGCLSTAVENQGTSRVSVGLCCHSWKTAGVRSKLTLNYWRMEYEVIIREDWGKYLEEELHHHFRIFNVVTTIVWHYWGNVESTVRILQ